jgi:aryl-alcohol dehydrogenase-like predicted oxidoreductase
LAVSAVGLGCNNLGREHTSTVTLDASKELIDAALDAGITLFDVADIYGKPAGRSEEFLGAALGKRRGDVVLATKFGMDAAGANGPDFDARGSRRYIRAAVEASLRRLNTDWIDLYQFHQPDSQTPIEETLAALDDLVVAGKVRYIGHSNFAGWQAADAAWVARSSSFTPFISAQNEYSLLNRDVERDLLPAAEHFGLGVLPFFPLANGLLTGKYSRSDAPAGSRLREQKPHLLDSAPWDRLEKLQTFADERGVSMLQVAFGWLLSHSQVSSVIAGATSTKQLLSNVQAGNAFVPTTEDLEQIDAIFPPPS